MTQLTSKSTAVTINKNCGRITMANSALASNAVVVFAVNNSLVAATDVIACCQQGGTATNGTYQVWTDAVASGVFVIGVRNISGGSLSEALTINFSVIKAVTA